MGISIYLISKTEKINEYITYFEWQTEKYAIKKQIWSYKKDNDWPLIRKQLNCKLIALL